MAELHSTSDVAETTHRLDDTSFALAGPVLEGGIPRAMPTGRVGGDVTPSRRRRRRDGADREADLAAVLAYLRAVAYLRLPRHLAATMVAKGETLLHATGATEPAFITVIAAHLRQHIPLKLSRQGEAFQTFIDSLITDFAAVREFSVALPERYDATDPVSELPMRQLDLAEARRLVTSVLESLTERERDFIQCRYWEGLSCEDTGALFSLGRSRTSEIVQDILAKVALAIARYRRSERHRDV